MLLRLGFQAPGPASLSSSCRQQATWPWALWPADGHFTGILLVPSQPTCMLLLVCVSSSFGEEEVKQRVGELFSLGIYALLSPHLQLPCQLAHCSLASLLSFSEKCPSQFDPHYFFLGAAVSGSWVPSLVSSSDSSITPTCREEFWGPHPGYFCLSLGPFPVSASSCPSNVCAY